MLDSNRQQNDNAGEGGFQQPRFNNNNNNQGGYGQQGGYNNNQAPQGGYGNNNANQGFQSPKPQPAAKPLATAPADLDDDLPF